MAKNERNKGVKSAIAQIKITLVILISVVILGAIVLLAIAAQAYNGDKSADELGPMVLLGFLLIVGIDLLALLVGIFRWLFHLIFRD